MFLRIFYKHHDQISINTVLSARMEKETGGGGWKNESQWSRFSGIKGGVRFSRRTRFHASLVRRWIENDAHCFCGEMVSDTRRLSETDDYANRE